MDGGAIFTNEKFNQLQLAQNWESEMTEEVLAKLANIEVLLQQVISAKVPTQNYYSTADAAKILGRAEWTIREHCRLGRVHAEKRASGRGAAKEWMISAEELRRIKSEGLLPLKPIVRRHSNG